MVTVVPSNRYTRRPFHSHRRSARASRARPTEQAAVEGAATAGHEALAEACRELEASQHAVERLYARWQELEAKRG